MGFGKENTGGYAEYKVIAIVVNEGEVELTKSGRAVEYPDVDKALAEYVKQGWTPISMNMDPEGFGFLLGRGYKG